MSKNLDKLEQLTPHLSELLSSVDNGYIEYNVEKGAVFGLGLYKNHAVAVQRAFVAAGSIFPAHNHEGKRELMMVYSGKFRVEVEGREPQILNPSDFIVIEPGETHRAEAFEEDVWLIAIIIPADEGFPDASTAPIG